MAENFDHPWSETETAGSPALSFVNTLDWRLREAPEELFQSYDDLLRWARTELLLTAPEARMLRAKGRKDLRTSAGVLKDAVELREAAAVLWAARAGGKNLPAGALAVVDRFRTAAQAARSLTAKGSVAGWTWRRKEAELERPLWAAALAVVELLISGDHLRIRQCGDAECGWFFLDTSKNGSRRWCSMKSCGNRNKARRFYGRVRAGG